MMEEQTIVTVSHAKRLIKVYASDKPSDRPWYYEWAQTIVRLADALEAAGVSPEMVEEIGHG